MNPLISIVVPIYNTEKYLIETVDSVLNQTYGNWELLLIDDGSSDGSREICEMYTNSNERIFYYYKENGGQASARNFGIKQSKGKYISFLDSDDIWLPNKLSDQIEDLKKYNPDFLYGLGYYYYPKQEKELVPYEWICGEMTGNSFFNTLYHSCAVNTNTVLIRKTLFNQVGYFNESEVMRGTEDWDLWLRIAKMVKKVYGSPKRNVYYRIHPGGIHLQKVRISDKTISRLMRLREYRYNYRELINHLWDSDKANEIKNNVLSLAQKDPYGLVTFSQRILIHLMPLKAFMWISQKIIYRIGFRLEHFTYRLFLR